MIRISLIAVSENVSSSHKLERTAEFASLEAASLISPQSALQCINANISYCASLV